MEPIAGLPELRPVLISLKAKGLVIALTPEGRGHVVTHALSMPQEMEKLRSEYRGRTAPVSAPAVARESTAADHAGDRGVGWPGPAATEPREAELAELRGQIAEIRQELDELAASQRRSEEELRELRAALGG
jgi:hypothetical protein